MSEKKYIRFINSDYKTLFHLPDGGRIKLTYPDGKQRECVCRFIDECHTQVGSYLYHICEFAEQMERNGVKYEPLDYIHDPEFYTKYFFAADGKGKGPVYYIVDESDRFGVAIALKGAAKGRKYCVFEKLTDGSRRYKIGGIIKWCGTLKELRPKDWGFDPNKIKAVAQHPKSKKGPER